VAGARVRPPIDTIAPRQTMNPPIQIQGPSGSRITRSVAFEPSLAKACRLI
jgi:hypothetical protein